jgi:hypothetical protein
MSTPKIYDLNNYLQDSKYIKFTSQFNIYTSYTTNNECRQVKLEDKIDDCCVCLEKVNVKKGFFECNHFVCTDCFCNLTSKKCCICRST